MYIISSKKTLKNITGAKSSDKNNDKPYVPQDPQYTPAGTFDNTQVKIYSGNENYIHAGIEQKFGENWSVTPSLIVTKDHHGLHIPYGSIGVEYTWK